MHVFEKTFVEHIISELTSYESASEHTPTSWVETAVLSCNLYQHML